MENRKKLARIKSRAQTRDKDKSLFNIFVKLFTDEKFPLKGVSNDMKIKELKQYMEFATGIPVHMQRISYLDDGKGQFHCTIFCLFPNFCLQIVYLQIKWDTTIVILPIL